MLNAHSQTRHEHPFPASAANHQTHRVLELFAGVGGFHFGLDQVNAQRASLGLPRAFDVVWANQWEPGVKAQHAARVYEARWGMAPVNRDLFDVLDDVTEMARIDTLAPTMLVGGFPCQDYSVARPSSKSQGLQGKKGVLWWGIHRLLQLRLAAGQPIQTVMLENVDRLINSSTACRGRDFAIILSSLQGLGYGVAWQVVDASAYGFAQKRKRVFIVAVHETAPEWQVWRQGQVAPETWLTSGSPLARGLPVRLVGAITSFALGADPVETQASYQSGKGGKTLFANAGVCIAGRVWTGRTVATAITDCSPYVGRREPLTLGDIVAATTDVTPAFYLSDESLARWQHLKGAKAIPRSCADGHSYEYKEGAMAFPDSLDKPSRTVITSEGGATASRTTHVVRAPDGRLRRLTPDELDALNGFPRGFTRLDGVSDTKRAFLMGNALVTGIVSQIALCLDESARLATDAVDNAVLATSTAVDAVADPQDDGERLEPSEPATQAASFHVRGELTPRGALARCRCGGARLARIAVRRTLQKPLRRLYHDYRPFAGVNHELAPVPDHPPDDLPKRLSDPLPAFDIRLVCHDGRCGLSESPAEVSVEHRGGFQGGPGSGNDRFGVFLFPLDCPQAGMQQRTAVRRLEEVEQLFGSRLYFGELDTCIGQFAARLFSDDVWAER